MKTLLEAVNAMLETINEQPLIDDVDLANSLEGTLAQTILNREKSKILSYGWDVNTDEDWEFVPDIDGIISIPSNVLEITSKDGVSIMRDWRLYNKQTKTFKYTAPVPCDVKWDLDFADLTYSLAFYITKVAARAFQMVMIGDKEIDSKLAEEEAKALIIAKENEGFTDQPNMLTNNYGMTKRRHF